MPDKRILISDFLDNWQEYRSLLTPHSYYDGEYIIIPHSDTASDWHMTPSQVRKIEHPLTMQLPPDNEEYPYISIYEIVKSNQKWPTQRDAYAWLQSLEAHNYVIIDTETTGSRRYSQIIEIAILDNRGNEIYHSLLNPTTSIEPIASSIHGLTYTDVKDAPRFSDIYTDIYGHLQDKLVLAYNVSFDTHMLFRTARAFSIPFPKLDVACLMYCYSKLRGEKTPGNQYKRCSLANACLHMGIDVPIITSIYGAHPMLEHRAGSHARYSYNLLQRMIAYRW